MWDANSMGCKMLCGMGWDVQYYYYVRWYRMCNIIMWYVKGIGCVFCIARDAIFIAILTGWCDILAECDISYMFTYILAECNARVLAILRACKLHAFARMSVLFIGMVIGCEFQQIEIICYFNGCMYGCINNMLYMLVT